MSGSSSSRVLLGDLCTLIVEQVDPLTTAQDRCYIGLEHLRPGRLRVENSGRATDVQSHKFAFVKGDVLYGKLRPYLDKAILADVDGICTTELLVLRAKAGITPEFLVCAIHSPDFIEHAMSGVTGAHHPRTSWGHISTFEVSSLSESQQRVASQLLWRIQNLIVKCERGIITAQKIKYETMNQLFARGLRGEAQKETDIGPMPQSWNPKSILELCDIWSGGTPRKSVAEYWSGEIPWVSGKDLKLPALDDVIDHISVAGVDAGSRIAPKGAVLLLVRGMGLAKDLPVAVIKRPMAFNQDVKALVTRGQYSGEFLRSAIYAGKDRLLSQIVPSAHGTMTLNLNDVESFKIACPSDNDEAAEIVTMLDVLDQKIALHQQKKSVLNELFRSLLHKLMTGEISFEDLDLSALTDAEPQPQTEAEVKR